MITDPSSPQDDLEKTGGGKAINLWRMSQFHFCRVPSWFCLTTRAFDEFVEENELVPLLTVSQDIHSKAAAVGEAFRSARIPYKLEEEILKRLDEEAFQDRFVAVRSSGTDEDSAAHSFAGQFETYLFRRGGDQVLEAVRRCWASCFSERVMKHRQDCGMLVAGVKMAVVVQVMIDSEFSGVAFSRHPLKPITSMCAYIEAVFGQGEGLVSGELTSDSYEADRRTLQVTSIVAKKEDMFVRASENGVTKVAVSVEKQDKRVLTDQQAVEIAQLVIALETNLGRPQDFEWAHEKGNLYCLQARPIATLPPTCFLDLSVIGCVPTLWDNSNIVESYSGVTTPLTFSFASNAYSRVYSLSLKIAGVPDSVVQHYKSYLDNMLGYVRGNIYYNLLNWYRCLSLIPIGDSSKFMDTMMGVKLALENDLEHSVSSIKKNAPKYSLWTKVKVFAGIAHKIYYIDSFVDNFFANFNMHYEAALAKDLESMSLVELMDHLKYLHVNMLDKWEVPIYNDTYVMIFFGLLKKLVTRFMCTGDDDKAQSLQNDLLCGQGDVESTKPTKMLMKIAQHIDSTGGPLRQWFLTEREEVAQLLESGTKASTVVSEGVRHRRSSSASVNRRENGTRDLSAQKSEVLLHIRDFLTRYGFRCVDELKLESKTLHDDPGFVLDAIAGYIRSQSYSVESMEKREKEIKEKAEAEVTSKLPFHKRVLFNWVLFHVRRGIRHRENTRFARTKMWGCFRSAFRAIGSSLERLSLIDNKLDVFYLTVDELFAFTDGRSVTNNLRGLIDLRRVETDEYRKSLPPPERFATRGACGPYWRFPALLDDLNLLKQLEAEASSDPNVLKGTPCCPGVVEAAVRVVSSIDEARSLDNEILVTARTDPGWVPLYPMCKGLLIERGRYS
ncbi:prodigiosin synthesizing transferase PigC-like isoform X2 [Corticium candelabrum]|uniref:prodigiosin synthesizing transferase PigC-like isoform X2 n=1 Tax=Corticium candelabrum TaxID=121492 RepID=UPI002E26E91E|nr:prodigiosin synthesizing transferase PigC-like isoform X2 [Corticium candelabrum]